MSFGVTLPSAPLSRWRKIRRRLVHGVRYLSLALIFKAKGSAQAHEGENARPVLKDAGTLPGALKESALLSQSEKEKERLFFFSIDMLCVIGYDGHFKSVNPAFQKTLGFSGEDFLTKPFLEFVYSKDRAAAREEFLKLRDGIPTIYFENRCRHKDGGYRWLSWTGHPVASERLIYAVARDVTRQHEMKETLKKMAFADVLTGLYNRRGFFIVAERMLKIAYRRKMGFLLMVADLDDMKHINDHFGHREGDSALMATAEIFRHQFRDSDIVARIGGDEFAAALLIDSRDQRRTIQEGMESSLADYNHHKAAPLYRLSLSMGFAYAPPDIRTSLDELIARADQAMYEVKQLTHELE